MLNGSQEGGGIGGGCSVGGSRRPNIASGNTKRSRNYRTWLVYPKLHRLPCFAIAGTLIVDACSAIRTLPELVPTSRLGSGDAHIDGQITGHSRETPITKRTACCRPAFIDAFGAPLSASVEFWRRIRSWVGAISGRDSLAHAMVHDRAVLAGGLRVVSRGLPRPVTL